VESEEWGVKWLEGDWTEHGIWAITKRGWGDDRAWSREGVRAKDIAVGKHKRK
jgi:hypothetical protein